MENRQSALIHQTRSLSMTAELRHAISLLRHSNVQLTSYVAALAATNPHIRMEQVTFLQAKPVWLNLVNQLEPPSSEGAAGSAERVRSGQGGAGFVGQGAGGGIDGSGDIAAPAAGLMAHVQAQIALLIRDPAERQIAQAYAEALEPSGWIACSVADVARRCNCTLPKAEAVLARLQQAEPSGLFARSLAECLALQAEDLGVMAPDFAALLANLPLIARGEIGALARICGCSEDRALQMIRVLRGMNPKPGAAFDAHAEPVREPDLIVRRQARRWLVELNRSNLPAIEVCDTLADATPGAGPEALRAARWLERAVLRRNATTLRIGAEVVRQQGAFLVHGPARLVPLSFADVAQALGLHASTVSRVTTGLLVETPRGGVMLRDFFSAALVSSGAAEEVATATVRFELAQLVASEKPSAPLSDAAIAAHFEAKGILLARRTVAKYRGLAHIPCSTARFQHYRLQGKA
jgi:RNA polymerase sigma-54 factor